MDKDPEPPDFPEVTSDKDYLKSTSQPDRNVVFLQHDI